MLANKYTLPYIMKIFGVKFFMKYFMKPPCGKKITCTRKQFSSVFGMQTLGDYHYHLLETDVLLLTNVIESYRNVRLQFYEIDPCKTFTAACLAWNAMFKITFVRFELVNDIDMHLFVERYVSGGVSPVTAWYRHVTQKPTIPKFPHTTRTNQIIITKF